jgi:hypothetical protein
MRDVRLWNRGKSMAQDMYFELSLFLKRNGSCIIVVPCRAHVISSTTIGT